MSQSKLSKKPKAGITYILQDRNDPTLYKLGETCNFKRRLKDLDHPIVIKNCECRDREAAEKVLHDRFETKRLAMSEWFRLDDSDVKEACSLLEATVKQQKRTTFTSEFVHSLYSRYRNGAGIRDLAEEVGVGHTTIYKHFTKHGLELAERPNKGDAIDPNLSVYIRPSQDKWLRSLAQTLNYTGQEGSPGTSRAVRELIDWISSDDERLRQFIGETQARSMQTTVPV
jgi:hypothetical protein